jgi:sulfhydrogenase subunit beta (sulfur reductase)
MIYRLLKNKLDHFLQALSKNRQVFALEEKQGGYALAGSEQWLPGKHTLGAFRPAQPLKTVLFPSRASVGTVMEGGNSSPVRNRIVFGAKNCDLSALTIHDHVFLNEPVDPFYKELREKTVLVGSDCTGACDVCFCTAVGEQPYPEKGFDINISETTSSYLLETGSPLGEELCQGLSQYLDKPDDPSLKERDRNRQSLYDQVAGQAAAKGLEKGQDYRKAVQATIESDLWETFAHDCVECGACNLICCTCHCFLLADGTGADKKLHRTRLWDSCLYLNFARVAGGANPRRHRAERLYNRFDKKFNFFPEVIGRFACDGCGRCVQACTGKIDIRAVLKKAVDES